jgi:hypothetical protein
VPRRAGGGLQRGVRRQVHAVHGLPAAPLRRVGGRGAQVRPARPLPGTPLSVKWHIRGTSLQAACEAVAWQPCVLVEPWPGAGHARRPGTRGRLLRPGRRPARRTGPCDATLLDCPVLLGGRRRACCACCAAPRRSALLCRGGVRGGAGCARASTPRAARGCGARAARRPRSCTRCRSAGGACSWRRRAWSPSRRCRSRRSSGACTAAWPPWASRRAPALPACGGRPGDPVPGPRSARAAALVGAAAISLPVLVALSDRAHRPPAPGSKRACLGLRAHRATST